HDALPISYQEDRAVQYFSSMRMYGVPLAPITTPILNEYTIPHLIGRGDRVIYRTILLIPFIFIIIGIDVAVRMTSLMRVVDLVFRCIPIDIIVVLMILFWCFATRSIIFTW